MDLSRQQYLVPDDALSKMSCDVIGVGAVGRQLALQLAAIGVRHINLIDNDIVEESNITTQMYSQDDIGRPKVDATSVILRRMRPECLVFSRHQRWTPKDKPADAVFCCVDSIKTRAAIHRTASRYCKFWCDARMMGETVYVYPAITPEDHVKYRETLFDSSEAEPGRCTSEATVYAACWAAASMVSHFARYLRGESAQHTGGCLLDYSIL
jgi:sulfur carrier protein ThiS adenylyltransferase